MEDIIEIAKKVSHRGPNSTEVKLYDLQFKSGNFGHSCLFFNRLAILDLASRSNQPFEDDRFSLLFNGEIYNFKELRETLKSQGVKFKTTSDTEVLFYSLKIWGEKALLKLNGMFAFFWLDREKKTFILGRDRMGIKPLYYKIEKNTLLFSSEIYSIIRLSEEKVSFDYNHFNSFLWLQYIPTPYCGIKSIFKLYPGSFLEGSIKEGTLIIKGSKIYFDSYKIDANRTESDIEGKELEVLLKKSLEGQLQADVPLGLFLSSGIDSSLLTAIINKYFSSSNNFNFFTIAFDERTESDESKDAYRFLKGFNNSNLVHHELNINADLINSRINHLYDFVDEPFADPTILLNWAISEKAREHSTVILSGDGADELFWGYPRYSHWERQSQHFTKAIPFLNSLTKIVKYFPKSRTSKYITTALERDPLNIYLNLIRPKGFYDLNSISESSSYFFLEGIKQVVNSDELPGKVDLKSYLLDAMLYKVDRSSMAASLEVRVPYLDNLIVDYALSLNKNEKCNNSFSSKAPLKELLKKLAPHYPIHQKKKGFNFPLKKWMKNNWKDLILSTITREALSSAGLNSKIFLKLVSDFYKKDYDNEIEIWHLFNLILWQNTINKVRK